MKYYRLLLWVLVIGVLCFTPGNQVREIKFSVPYFDKFIHFVMFYILGLFIHGLDLSNKKEHLIFICLACLYASLIEIVQHYFIDLRGGDMFDFFADFVGLIIGYLTYKFYPHKLKLLLR